ncbi:MAG: acyl-CoA synthetase, partial [Myxococcales bacterium]|nr:acyl-CoA synthetase [Myxococcales bacterium]
DLIIIKGANHHPQDLEWAIGELEGVRRGNVCAFSVVRDGTEELVIMAEAARADAARLRREIAARVYEDFGLQVADVVISPVGTLPKTSSGKHQRRKTQLLYERGELEMHAPSLGE